MATKSIVKRRPIDFDILEKGDVIPTSDLEALTGEVYGTSAYSLAILKYQMEIRNRLADRGLFVTVKCDRGALRILTDSEASQYNFDRCRAHVRGIVQSHSRAVNVDVAILGKADITAHTRRLAISGHFVQAVLNARKTLPVTGHKRKTPGLPSE